ncbi:MAG: phytanoyl-CoA dioxygenase family protein [Anaerolineae bacterium]|nr:phytanoyl-CoA dioxygenase family protein [Anaerolineae bacterium]
MTSNQLPALDTLYPIKPEQIHSYQENGHILLREVASAEEVAAFRPVISGAAMAFNTEKRALADRSTYGKAFLQITNLWARDEAVKRFTLARRFAQIAADLMGVEGVRIYHDQALYKEAGGGFTPWHQDQHYWPLDTNNTVTMWMPLVDLQADMGIMQFASGSHKIGYLGDLPISDESETKISQYVQENGYSMTQATAMKAGDATFHSGWTLHSAPGNKSDTMREVMTVIYFADGVKVAAADNPNREQDLAHWLPGCQPGDEAASELNPLVYKRS